MKGMVERIFLDMAHGHRVGKFPAYIAADEAIHMARRDVKVLRAMGRRVVRCDTRCWWEYKGARLRQRLRNG